MITGEGERAQPLGLGAEGVTVAVGRAMLLSELSLQVAPGERVALLGPNGAGKSTLLALFNAMLRPSTGRVMLDGEDVWSAGAARRAALRDRIATVFQRLEHNPLVPATVADVVGMAMPAAVRRNQAEVRERIDDALERMGIAAFARRPYRGLSGGEQQKVQLAMAVARRPGLILLDEPATGLDLDWQERLVAMLEELGSAAVAGVTIMLATHVVHQVPAGFDRVVLLKCGRVLFDGRASEAFTAERLGELYGCRVEVERRHGRTYCLGAGPARSEVAP
ncbi:hypothetical protein CVU37_10350 [candidate division BRC1 bacterium HGW-BRC1-1]|nr:MAG: hypothetical protein CVU37_10350 [candidate division BRC1 bacterium HGW-BRC1-1]